MAIDWLKQVIDNKELKDDMVITLAGGQTVPLGDIRNLTKSQQSLLATRESNVAAKELELRKNLETLQLAQAETAKLFTELQSQKGSKGNNNNNENNNNNVVNPFEALERDPILGPLAKAYREQSAAMEDIKTKALAPIVKAQQDMAKVYVQDRIEDLYERTVPDAKKDKITLDSILKHANDNKLYTSSGIPDIRKAYREITTKPITQEDLDAQLKAAREEGIKSANDAARLRVPRPGIGQSGGRPESSFKPTKLTTVSDALGEALAAAAKDADIWANVDSSVIQ